MQIKSQARSNKIKGNRGFHIFVGVFVTFFTLFALIPFWLVIINSFASEANIARHGFQIWPEEFSLDAYTYVFKGNQVYYSYRNTLMIVGIGTPMAVMVTAMFAYVLAHPKVRYARQLSFLTYFTMIMGTSMVGTYILISTWMGMRDNLWALILPRLINPFYVFILVAAYRGVPHEIYESAALDGANDWRVFFQIVLPIVVPAIATITLFIALYYWNDWWLALMFIDNYKMHPLQMMIRSLISSITASSYLAAENMTDIAIPTNAVKMAVVCVTVGPIILVYPFVQKYFVKGITVGAVKG